MKKTFKFAFKKTIPVLIGYMFLGMALGLLMTEAGYPVWYKILMGVIIYSGTMEYAAIPIFAQPFDPLGSFMLGFLLSVRYLFYGLSMLGKYQNYGTIKPYMIMGLTDETFSINSTTKLPDDVKEKPFCILVTVLNHSYWIAGGAIGAIIGEYIPFELKGLDFALTAVFITMLIDQLQTKEGRISGATGLVGTFLVLMLFGSDRMVLISLFVILAVLLAERKKLDVND